ncbi:hypothetical protein C6P45_002316 [Maudiozyma exigua]|uniref:Protein PAL1 n=1 Tax=Maudiozyma exigua TaxID=34358 RepID=A0A9P7B3X8_MAUEX|nr:hypothetical protein C6P45_002316 [Kazachstania exigua]
MHSSLQTPSSTGSGGRPFSTTNPFRTSVATDTSLNQYSHDSQFQDWARNQFHRDSTLSNQTIESPMFANVATPPSKSSTNPFLDDDDDDDDESDQEQNYFQPGNNNNNNNNNNNGGRNQQHLSAREEKDQLRQRYMEERNLDDRRTPAALRDMPPAYDEVPSNRRNNSSGYSNNEKHRNSRSHSGPHNTSSTSGPSRRTDERSGSGSGSGSASGSDRPRVHRGHSSRDRVGERERRGSDHHHHSSSSSSAAARREKRKSKLVPAKGVDTIDKLDVTGLFGGSFHHDGPFDACTPHRNKNSKAAPVMAFPADGPNSTIGGTFRKKSAMDEVFGVDDADDDLYQVKGGNVSKDAIRANVDGLRQVDATSKGEKVHGPTTSGLGSTTFLDGAPAPMRSLHRGQSVSYRQSSYNSNASNNSHNAGIRRNMTISSRPSASPSAGYTPNSFNRDSISPTYGTNNNHSFGDDEDDIYLGGNSTGSGVRFDSGTKKSSTGNKFLKRVKSLKVGGKKH